MGALLLQSKKKGMWYLAIFNLSACRVDILPTCKEINASGQTPLPQLCCPENRAADEAEDESQWIH